LDADRKVSAAGTRETEVDTRLEPGELAIVAPKGRLEIDDLHQDQDSRVESSRHRLIEALQNRQRRRRPWLPAKLGLRPLARRKKRRSASPDVPRRVERRHDSKLCQRCGSAGPGAPDASGEDAHAGSASEF